MTVVGVLVNHYPDCEPSEGEQKTTAFYATGLVARHGADVERRTLRLTL